MPDPVVLGVGEPVRKPLRFEQIETILAEIQRFAAFEVTVFLVVVIQVQ